MGYIRPDFPKLTSRISWLLIGGEHLRKSSEKSSESVGKGSERVGKARRKKKQGGVGGGRPEKRRGGVGE